MDPERHSHSSEASRSAERDLIRALSAEQRLLRALSLWDDMQALRAVFAKVIPAASGGGHGPATDGTTEPIR